uniref:Ubiquitin-like protein 7 n=1 Tax=Timema genevievae TaxID=629358 RepID=A0A7R9K4P7_TIMGE|nr:unnamed protein product [Timema genevievae]
MACYILLGIRLTPNTFDRVKIPINSLDIIVEQLRREASKTTHLPRQFLELIYCGNILDDDATLRSCGIKEGVMVHVLRKKEKEMPIPDKTMTEAEIQELVLAFRTFTRHHSLRNALQRLSRPEVLENIMMATPTLRDDPVAMSIIRDPELLVHMESIDTVRRVAELHPALAEAANHIAAVVHEEATTGSSSTQGQSSGYSYSLDALSDEEDMDSSQSSDSQPQGSGLSRQQSYSAITAAQLAAALASATGLFPSSPGASNPGPSNSLITSEMFSHAMERAIANVSTSSGDTPLTGDSDTAFSTFSSEMETNQDSAPGGGWQTQLQQMRELGLTDDAVNTQALQATGGDVQSAIELVFSGAITPDSH